MANHKWHRVSHPIQPGEPVPPERKVVLVWCEGKTSDSHYLPWCGYLRYAAGDPNCPFFVVYHGNPDLPADVVAWCDCLPENGPDWVPAKFYEKKQVAKEPTHAR